MKKALIYIVLFIFGVFAFPVLLFLNWRNKEKDYKNYLIASGVGFGFFIIGSIFEEETDQNQNLAQESIEVENEEIIEETPEVEVEQVDVEEEVEEDPEEDTPEFDNVFEEAAHEVFGTNLLDVEVHGEESPRVNVSAEMSDSFTTRLIQVGIHSDMADFLEIVADADFGEIYISNRATLVDAYGNESDNEVAYGLFSKSTVDNINFENFNYNNIPNIADDYFLHQSMQ